MFPLTSTPPPHLIGAQNLLFVVKKKYKAQATKNISLTHPLLILLGHKIGYPRSAAFLYPFR